MNQNHPVVLASDHAGYQLKRIIIKHLSSQGWSCIDLGTDSDGAVDYPDFGHLLAGKIKNDENLLGISICGSGNGINMTTNKHQGIRGAICWNEEIAALARSHNNANICSLPARFISEDMALKIVDVFLSTDFDGGRHARRIKKIDE